MTTLMGYADKISLAPGETIQFKVSCAGAERYRAEIRRVLSPEAGPDAPPFRTELVESAANREYRGREQTLYCGSWAMVKWCPLIAAIESFTIQAFIWPTLPGVGRQAILGTWAENLGSGFGLMLDEKGALELRVGDDCLGSGGAPLLPRKWHFVAASYDAASRSATLYQELLADKTMTRARPLTGSAVVSGKHVFQPAPFMFAAWFEGDSDETEFIGRPIAGGHFNGKMDRPRLANRALSRAEMAAHRAALPAPTTTTA